MGLWNKIGSAISNGFKAGKKYITDNAGTIGNIGLAAINPVAGAGMYLARSKFGKSLWEKAKEYAPKAWNATKDFASKHADTIGNVAGTALNAIHPGIGAGVGMIANHFANDKTGWGRFAKSLANGTGGGALSNLLKQQSNAADVSNGHVATGYSISSTGNNSKPAKKNYNGYNRMVSDFLG